MVHSPVVNVRVQILRVEMPVDIEHLNFGTELDEPVNNPSRSLVFMHACHHKHDGSLMQSV